MPSSSAWLVSAAIIIPFVFALYRSPSESGRPSKVPKAKERVVILGASSGIGQAIALLYAARGASVCLVARRKTSLDQVVEDCCKIGLGAAGDVAYGSGQAGKTMQKVFGVVADFTNVQDMVRVRAAVEMAWQGIDTVVVAAGVSALQPLMAVAGVEAEGKVFKPEQATSEGLQRMVDVASAATTGNFVGPLVAAVTFIPMLSNTSPSPSILLLSSLAAVIPAPTRALYAATKSASLLLYQALAIEHPQISFSFVLPSTVEGDFRASAVDGGPVREADPNKAGLKREVVARRCVRAVDGREKTVFMPRYVRFGHFLYWIWPGFVEWMASQKYKFAA